MKIETSNEQRDLIINKNKCYYVDLDGTLAEYNDFDTIGSIGEPVPNIKRKVLEWIEKGIKVKIFTARASKKELIPPIRLWLSYNGLPPDLEITNIKGFDCDRIFDNIAREVIFNKGIIISSTGDIDE